MELRDMTEGAKGREEERKERRKTNVMKNKQI